MATVLSLITSPKLEICTSIYEPFIHKEFNRRSNYCFHGLKRIDFANLLDLSTGAPLILTSYFQDLPKELPKHYSCHWHKKTMLEFLSSCRVSLCHGENCLKEKKRKKRERKGKEKIT